ncbi:MAG TPA: class I SAM-dependent methyltransferase [Vicinamibacterales bacterium]|nr:class I SAM-dependent methyltransferase [Vicinamibacterales bacterium]
MTITSAEDFVMLETCQICGGSALSPVHELLFELSIYATQDPELAAYSGKKLALQRCAGCGFAQPSALPSLPRFFDRLYDQRWSEEWIRAEYEGTYKDGIFHGILRDVGARLEPSRRRLLDVGAHAGRFITLARAEGWAAEGLELNPQTAAFAAEHTGATVRQLNVHQVDVQTAAFDAITVTDVLEHIPDPVRVLSRVAALLGHGGCVAVKVPSGPGQLSKELWRGRLMRSYRPTLADNLVHVNHFSPASLRIALERAGFRDITIVPGAPELPDTPGLRGSASRATRRLLHFAARTIPGGLDLPLTLNLQAYASRP